MSDRMSDAMRIDIEVDPSSPQLGLVAHADQSTASGRAIQIRVEEEVFLDLEWDQDEGTISWRFWTLRSVSEPSLPEVEGSMAAGYTVEP